jgi:hypothetical protein
LFQNNDNIGYLIQIKISPITIDHFLPALGSVTVFVDPGAPYQDVDYDLIAVDESIVLPPSGLASTPRLAAASAPTPTPEMAALTSSTGGKIIIKS